LTSENKKPEMATESPLSPILLLIDLQQGLVDGPPEWGGRSTPKLVENVKYMLKTWRSKNWPILHVQHDDIFDSTNLIAAIHPETYAIHSCAAPLPHEALFVKNVGSPFVASGLKAKVDEIMASDGERKEKRKIVVIGMDGAQCVNDTTRNGTDLGYKIVVVGDASASYGMEDWRTGKQLGAEETHNAAMDMLVGYCDGKVTTTEKVLEVLGF
jgi:nicotinamidase-related amidase